MADEDNAAELAGAMIRLRALARAEPGTPVYLPAGDGRRVGWTVLPDGTERVLVQRELRPIAWDPDISAVMDNLPPGRGSVEWGLGDVTPRYPYGIVATLAPDA